MADESTVVRDLAVDSLPPAETWPKFTIHKMTGDLYVYPDEFSCFYADPTTRCYITQSSTTIDPRIENQITHGNAIARQPWITEKYGTDVLDAPDFSHTRIFAHFRFRHLTHRADGVSST